jgi:heme/copper-type cytochrome/quinol oxidase subunit 2
MLWPASVPRASAASEGSSHEIEHIVIASAISAVIVLLAVLLLALLYRFRARRMQREAEKVRQFASTLIFSASCVFHVISVFAPACAHDACMRPSQL